MKRHMRHLTIMTFFFCLFFTNEHDMLYVLLIVIFNNEAQCDQSDISRL